MQVSAWKEALIDIDRNSEFVGDDVDRYSKLVDLVGNYEFLTVRLPALAASAVITPYVQEDEKVTKALDAAGPAIVGTIPTIVHILDDDATGSFAHATSSGAGDISITFRIGGYQYVRIHAGANQSADRSIQVRGFNK